MTLYFKVNDAYVFHERALRRNQSVYFFMYARFNQHIWERCSNFWPLHHWRPFVTISQHFTASYVFFFTDFRLQESFFNLPQLLFPENVMQNKDNTLGMVYVRNSIQNTIKMIYLEVFCSLKNCICKISLNVTIIDYLICIFFLYILTLNSSGPETQVLISHLMC